MISLERDLKPYLHTANGSDRGFSLKAAQSPHKRADFARESLKDAFCSVIAAATEYNYDCQNNNPGAVIVEKMAQAVVVHICFPPNVTLRVFSLA